MDEIQSRDGLLAPTSYWEASPEVLARNTNGAGTSGWNGLLVPDTVWGLNINAAANIHDFEYCIGETIEHKQQADFRFQQNMISLIRRAATRSWIGWILKFPREYRAFTYYLAVSESDAALVAFRASELT
jgi:hypothetical protein